MERDFAALSLVERLTSAGHQALYAGGFVRDLLLGHHPADIDIATSCPAEELATLFPKTIPVGIQFGSVIVPVESHQFEVTTFRKEGPYLDGRRPSTVEASSAEEDAKRRSFTINGMFYDPLKDEILDYVGGQADLKKGIIRAIGDPMERFAEDKLRMIRAVRFATRFDFAIEPKTQAGIQATVDELYPAVAVERIWQEFNKMQGPAHFGRFVTELYHYGLLQIIFPEAHTEEIDERVATLVELPEESPTIALLMQLFPESPLSERLAICDELKVSNRDKKLVERLTQCEELLERGSRVDWIRFYADPLSELCLKIVAARLDPEERGPFFAHHLRARYGALRHIERLERRTPLVTSDHLKERGIQPGPEMGKLLAQAEELAIREDLHHPSEVLDRITARGRP
ncbi:MAG: CCA tRNA nucleotidyltransferase [Parachlamydiales bacterium]